MEQGRVLLLDDDKEILETCGEVLSSQGFEISPFHEPAAALEALATGHQTDVILADFRMPQMNGLQFLERVQELNIAAPLIMFTGVADKELAIKALNSGCHFLLEKPVRNQELIHYTAQAVAYGRRENISSRLLHASQELIGLLRNLSSVYESRFAQAEQIISQNKGTGQTQSAEIQGYLKNIAQGISIQTEIQNASELVEALSQEHADLVSRLFSRSP
ncbi:response regulator [Oligoflexus tunisiensis]|uniref:response regulator n=1 Tax=Oligoflexus tunisiensis TaxID=708132 RepID=UPI00114CC60F|nr:response regulator [Oligoflexus tunisiensis]